MDILSIFICIPILFIGFQNQCKLILQKKKIVPWFVYEYSTNQIDDSSNQQPANINTYAKLNRISIGAENVQHIHIIKYWCSIGSWRLHNKEAPWYIFHYFEKTAYCAHSGVPFCYLLFLVHIGFWRFWTCDLFFTKFLILTAYSISPTCQLKPFRRYSGKTVVYF